MDLIILVALIFSIKNKEFFNKNIMRTTNKIFIIVTLYLIGIIIISQAVNTEKEVMDQQIKYYDPSSWNINGIVPKNPIISITGKTSNKIYHLKDGQKIQFGLKGLNLETLYKAMYGHDEYEKMFPSYIPKEGEFIPPCWRTYR